MGQENMTTARVGRFAVAPPVWVAALLIGLLMGGCSGNNEGTSSSKEPAGSADGGTTVPLQAEVGKVAGRLKPAAAAAASAGVTKVVDGWFESAYIGGEFPRTDFTDAFPGFLPGAAKDAVKDAALMTNEMIGGDIDRVTADLKQVKVDVLAADDRAAGATARFTLVFTTTGSYAKQVSIRGQLFLTRNGKKGWQVFGYDVTRSAR
jgi:hypothetical protein